MGKCNLETKLSQNFLIIQSQMRFIFIVNKKANIKHVNTRFRTSFWRLTESPFNIITDTNSTKFNRLFLILMTFKS